MNVIEILGRIFLATIFLINGVGKIFYYEGTIQYMENFDAAEKFYLAGLKIKPNHKGINEYLGELYIKTNRIELAKERLEVLKDCKCEEFEELKELIEEN